MKAFAFIIYHFHHLFAIICRSIFLQLEHHFELLAHLQDNQIRGNLSQNAPGAVVYLYDLSDILFFLSVIATFDAVLYFRTQMF